MKAIRYIVSGGSGAAVNLGSFFVLFHLLGVWYVAASVIAFILSFFVSFILQRFWTFGHRSRTGLERHAALYLLVALCNLALNTGIVYALVDFGHVWPLAAQFVGGIAVSFASYFIYNAFVFTNPKP